MTVEDNKALIRRYVEEVYNAHNLDIIDDFARDVEDGVDHLRQFFNAFPDSRTTVLDLIAEGDKVMARLKVEGTHEGPFAGQPATGKAIEFLSFRIYRIEDGKIVETWAMQDRLGLMEQLGLVVSAGDKVNWAAGDD